jgi:hypothetical protein
VNGLADRFGIGSLIDDLVVLLDAEDREAFLEVEIWYGVSRETVARFARHAEDFPEFTWPRR